MGKVPLTAEMALDGHDEWLPISRVLPRVKPDGPLALPAAAEPAPVDDAPVAVETPQDPEPPSAPSAAPAGEQSHVRARNTCVFWPAPAPSARAVDQAPSVASEPGFEAPSEAANHVDPDSSFVGEVVEGELLDDDEWKRATVRKRPAPLPKDWRQRTVLCAPDHDDEAVAERDVEAEGPITERMGAPETDRMPNVGEPNPDEAAAAQMRAWQATTQQRRIVRPGTPQSIADSRAQQWADQPWSPQRVSEPAPEQPWHEQPWSPRGGSGQG